MRSSPVKRATRGARAEERRPAWLHQLAANPSDWARVADMSHVWRGLLRGQTKRRGRDENFAGRRRRWLRRAEVAAPTDCLEVAARVSFSDLSLIDPCRCDLFCGGLDSIYYVLL